MNQSSLIAGALMVAFVAFVAINQRLGVYRNIVMGGAGGGSATPSPGSASLNPASPSFNPAQAGANAGAAVRNWIGGLFGGGGSSAPTATPQAGGGTQ